MTISITLQARYECTVIQKEDWKKPVTKHTTKEEISHEKHKHKIQLTQKHASYLRWKVEADASLVQVSLSQPPSLMAVPFVPAGVYGKIHTYNNAGCIMLLLYRIRKNCSTPLLLFCYYN
jgi:hypothetical protein